MAETSTELNYFFPMIIQRSVIAGGKELNKKILKILYDLKKTTPNSIPDSWSCSLYTTINSQDQLHEMPPFAALKRHILAEANKFARSLHIDTRKNKLFITSCWVNIYGPKDSQEIHHHSNNIFSGVYYVKAPKGSSGILFHSPISDLMLEPPYLENTSLNNTVVGYNPIEGQMLMFRSFLRHSVKPNPIQEDRISISFNLTM